MELYTGENLLGLRRDSNAIVVNPERHVSPVERECVRLRMLCSVIPVIVMAQDRCTIVAVAIAPAKICAFLFYELAIESGVNNHHRAAGLTTDSLGN